MTIKEVAKEAGVSVSTVSKIINNKADNISPATIDRVLEIAKKNHYVPYGKIKSTLNSKGFTLGVMLRSISASPLLLQGILSGARRQGYAVLVFDSEASVQQEENNFRNLDRHHIDGLLWEPVWGHTQLRREELGEKRVELQVLDNTSPAWYETHFREYGRLMTERLVTLGHTSIAFVKGDGVVSSALLSGYRQALYNGHLPIDPLHILSQGQPAPELVATGVSAFVCASPSLAQTVIESLTDAGFAVPEDVSVIALAEDSIHPCCHISAQKVPYEVYGQALAEELIALCEEGREVSPLPVPVLDLTCGITVDRAPTARKKRIIVLGSINADITLNVSQLPRIDSTSVCHSISSNLGGKGANQAMGVAKLDWPACLISKVGNDTDAAMALQELNNGGVNTEGVRRDLDSITGKAYIHVQEDGESILTLVPGANHAITAEYVDSCAYLFQNAGYCLLSNGPSMECVLQAARLSRSHGVKTIFKPSVHVEVPDELYRLTDILAPNRHAARRLAPFDAPEDQAAWFLEKGAKNVIITLGHRGCYLRTPTEEYWYDAPHVTAVDSTGAADAFIAALAVHLLRGYTLADAVEIASHAAGFCVTKQGVIHALADRAALEQYLLSPHPQLRRDI